VACSFRKKKGGKEGLSECSEQFEGIACFQVGLGESVDHGVVKPLSDKLSSIDSCGFVRPVLETEGFQPEPEEEQGE